MKLTDERATMKPLDELDAGDVFEFDENIWIKTDTTVNGLPRCTRIPNGHLFEISGETVVKPLDAEMVIRG